MSLGVLLGLGAVLALALGAVVLRRWRRGAVCRRARRELRRLEREWRRQGDLPALLAGIARVLRRTAVEAAGRPSLSGLTGAAWLSCLDELGGTRGFRQGPGAILRDGPYRRPDALPAVDVPAVLTLVHQWLDAVQRRTR